MSSGLLFLGQVGSKRLRVLPWNPQSVAAGFLGHGHWNPSSAPQFSRSFLPPDSPVRLLTLARLGNTCDRIGHV